MAAGGVDDDLARPATTPVAVSPATRAGRSSSGTVSSSSSACGDDLLDGADGYAGQQGRGARPGRLADAGDRDDAVAGPLQRGAEHGADPAGADDADAQPRRPVLGSAHSRNAISPPGHVACCPCSETPWAARVAGTPCTAPTASTGRTGGPAGHFATSTQGGPLMGSVLAAALVRLMGERGLHTLVDVGCGRGELLTEVHRLAPALRCVGRGRRRPARPARRAVELGALPGRGGPAAGAVGPGRTPCCSPTSGWTWCPCTVGAGRRATGCCARCSSTPRPGASGSARPAGRRRTCSGADAGGRVDGPARPATGWRSAAAATRRGRTSCPGCGRVWRWRSTTATSAAARPAGGTLTGYRDGRQVPPVPDGSCDITAHVAMDSLGADELVDQRTALRRLGVSGATPPHELATGDPAAYLAALATASAAAALTARGGPRATSGGRSRPSARAA